MGISFDSKIQIPKDSSALNDLNSAQMNSSLPPTIRLHNRQILFLVSRLFLKSYTEKITLPPYGWMKGWKTALK